jgi:hypothetical protein
LYAIINVKLNIEKAEVSQGGTPDE